MSKQQTVIENCLAKGAERAGIKQQRGQPRLVGGGALQVPEGWSRLPAGAHLKIEASRTWNAQPGNCTCRRRPRAFSGEVGFAVCALFSPFFGRAKKGKNHHCNQFEKTTTGLPFAYGIYVDSMAGIAEIGGQGPPNSTVNPSGNGWVGLSPGNSGYAVWNHPSNVQLTYFGYDNEQVFQPISFNTIITKPPVLAEPFFIPNTSTLNPNATCYDNATVYFPRPLNIRNQVTARKAVDTKGNSDVYIFPNPVSDNLQITIGDFQYTNSLVQVRLIDQLGKVVLNEELRIEKGIAELPIRNTISGMYQFIVIGTDFSQHFKLQVNK